jgi:hypothetical protein
MKIFFLVFTKNIAFGHSRIFLHVALAESLDSALLEAQAEFEKKGIDPSSMVLAVANEFYVPDPQADTPKFVVLPEEKAAESLKVILPESKADSEMERLLKTTAETVTEEIDKERSSKNELMKRIIKHNDRALLEEHLGEFKDYEIAFLEEELKK